MYLDAEFIICSVCWEPNTIEKSRCQNCRAILRRNTQRTNRLNPFYDRMNDIRLINWDESKGSSKKSKRFEILKEQKMNMDLYVKSEGGEVEAPICCICQDNIIKGQLIYKLSCQHIFHKCCASAWFKKKSECPFCRTQYMFLNLK